MVENSYDCVKTIADQKCSCRKTHEIISKIETQEHLLEATNAFIQCASKSVAI